MINQVLTIARYYMLVPSPVWQPLIQKFDIRQLCTVILNQTISDADKFQSGLTKIFFRAGMLAALETLRSERLNSMVTIVQKNMRRFMAMRQYQRLRQSTIRIQTWWRVILAKKFVEHVRREASAVRLQRALRRWTARQRFLTTKRDITLFQGRE